MKKLICLLVLFFTSVFAQAQGADEYSGGYTIKFNEDGSKSMRAILFGQTQFVDNEGYNANDGIAMRRARVILFSQLSNNLLITTHFGFNNLRAGDLVASGKSLSNTFAIHEFIIQYSINKNLQIGSGLHYWNGISRLNGLSSLSLTTLDINRSSNSTLGLSDQLGVHLGVYGKGKIGKLFYRLSFNDASVTSLDGNRETVLNENQEAYLGKALTKKGRFTYSGYLDYKFLDSESNFLPYQAGTYLGAKKIFNVGAGFYHHPDAIVKNIGGQLKSKDATHIGIDAFYDAPLGGNNGAISAYVLYQNSQMGDKYLYGNIVGAGNQFYGHLGYLIPKHVSEDKDLYKNRFQPYISCSYRAFKALDKAATDLKIGANWYLNGQNAKFTVEYQKAFYKPANQDDAFVVQAMLYL